MTTINYTPIFYTDASAFDYFRVFTDNMIFRVNINQSLRFFLLVICIAGLIMLMYKIHYKLEIGLRTLSQNKLVLSELDNRKISILYNTLLEAINETFTCQDERLINSNQETMFIGENCSKFI